MDLSTVTAALPDAPPPPIADAATLSAASKARIHKTAQDFESSFLQVMLGQMMSGAGQTDSSFSGGEGEQAFRSFLTEAMAKGVVKAGGVGVSQTVERELLRLQGGHA